MYSEIIRQRLISERNQAGYTQREITNLTGIPQPLIAKIESGKRTPDVETIGTLAELYHVSTDYLFGLGRKEKKTYEN